jgi:hypothetical protein
MNLGKDTFRTFDTYMFNREGILLSTSRFEDQLRTIGLLDQSQTSAMHIVIRDPGLNMLEEGRPSDETSEQPLTRMAAGAVALRLEIGNRQHDHSQLVIETDMSGYRDYRGVLVFGSWLWNSDLDIGIACEVDIEDALSGYSFIRSTVFWVLGFTLLLTVGAVLLVLAFGERTHRVLNKARIDLEKKVLERTADLVENQEKLKASEEHSRLILSSVGEGLFGVDSAGCVTFMNQATVAMLGNANPSRGRCCRSGCGLQGHHRAKTDGRRRSQCEGSS